MLPAPVLCPSSRFCLLSLSLSFSLPLSVPNVLKRLLSLARFFSRSNFQGPRRLLFHSSFLRLHHAKPVSVCCECFFLASFFASMPSLAFKLISSISSTLQSKRPNDNGIPHTMSSPVQSSPRKLYLYLPRAAASPLTPLFFHLSLLTLPPLTLTSYTASFSHSKSTPI